MIEPILINDNEVSGIDYVIQQMQIYLQNNADKFDYIYGRCYKTETPEGFIPEIYIGNDRYSEVFLSNKKNHIFFDVADETDIVYGKSKEYVKSSDINLIACINLEQVYDYSHRADENIVNYIEDIIKNYTGAGKWKLKKIIRKTKNVFKNYSYKLSDNKIDMQPYFVFSFEFELIYSNEKEC